MVTAEGMVTAVRDGFGSKRRSCNDFDKNQDRTSDKQVVRALGGSVEWGVVNK